jgi:hypothetical protein
MALTASRFAMCWASVCTRSAPSMGDRPATTGIRLRRASSSNTGSMLTVKPELAQF